jgi:hypothetical protein
MVGLPRYDASYTVRINQHSQLLANHESQGTSLSPNCGFSFIVAIHNLINVITLLIVDSAISYPSRYRSYGDPEGVSGFLP